MMWTRTEFWQPPRIAVGLFWLLAQSGGEAAQAPAEADVANEPHTALLRARAETDAAWAHFNAAAAEAAGLRARLVEQADELKARGMREEALRRKSAEAERALADALGALGQANARAQLACAEPQSRASAEPPDAQAPPAASGVRMSIDLEDQARSLATQHQTRLAAALQQAISAGGPVQAVEVCQLKAPRITQDLAAESGWEIRRVSQKLRNPMNAPDAWERAMLVDFERRRTLGEQGPMEVLAMQDGRFRYMRSIDTGAVCLACHGRAIEAKTLSRIDALYPADQARDYLQGQLRGAFSLSHSLPSRATDAQEARP